MADISSNDLSFGFGARPYSKRRRAYISGQTGIFFVIKVNFTTTKSLL